MTAPHQTDFYITHRLAQSHGSVDTLHARTHEHWTRHLEKVSDAKGLHTSAEGRLSARFQAHPDDVDAARSSLAREAGDSPHPIIIEPAIRMGHDHPLYRHLHAMASQGPRRRDVAPPEAAAEVEVHVKASDGTPISDAEVTAVLLDAQQRPRSVMAVTDREGRTRIEGAEPGETLAMITASPRAGFWGVVQQHVTEPVSVVCPPLPRDGPKGWWHRVLAAGETGRAEGEGVSVGVIDTGCGPVAQLAHVRDGGAIVSQAWSPDGSDVGKHGTFSCGVIGARPAAPGDYAGLAQNARIVSIRVYPDDTSGANQMDVAMAIDRLAATEKVDLVNLSLYSRTPSEIQRDAIRAALEKGTVCVCSAGNTGGPVGWPAAFPETVSITGLGQDDCAPAGSVDAIFVPTDPDARGAEGLYLATFANRGAEVTASAPAVAVFAPVPGAASGVFAYAAMSGTSVAAPMVCGALSAWLSRAPDYLALPRDGSRSARACEILVQRMRSIGMDASLVGGGILPLGSG